MMHSFETDRAAKEFVRERVDVPVVDTVELMDDGMMLRTFPQELEEGEFTNVYDLSFPIDAVRPSIELQDALTSVFEHARTNPDIRAATGGGFFFLADQASAVPRQLGLNLALAEGRMHGFPVLDREAVLVNDGRLSAEHVKALGVLALGDVELSWSGSLTRHETDSKVFASGNSIITHVQSDATGSVRVLDESSRYTSIIDTDDTVDIGFIRRDDGVFVGVSSSTVGKLNIFTHDVVVRTHERHAYGKLPEMRVRTLGSKAIDSTLQGAVSVGPMLDTENFTSHPVNGDKSLGGKPPFLDVPLARTVLYETGDGMIHIRLFDGRPGSPVFPGITPSQAAQSIKADGEIVWGCFLDPGQTAKLVVKGDSDLASYGNTHYLKWPKQPGDKFVWVPKAGRPVASMITLR
jgi:hypothetical protein